MKTRVFNPKAPNFADYGGRGIAVCERWENSFEAFLADMGERPAGLTLERIDNDGPYAPGNCRWATRAEQNRNTRRSHYLSFNGETLTLEDWAARLDIWPRSLRGRINRGWPIEKALSLPATVKNGHPTEFAQADNRDERGNFRRTYTEQP